MARKAPTVIARCSTRDCETYDEERRVPAGVMLDENTLLTGTMSCMTCGNPLDVDSAGRRR